MPYLLQQPVSLGSKDQPFRESFHRKISVLKLKQLAVVGTCIPRVLARAKTDVQLMPVFVHLLLKTNVDKGVKKE